MSLMAIFDNFSGQIQMMVADIKPAKSTTIPIAVLIQNNTLHTHNVSQFE
jgi:hypothetical protein